MSGPPEDRASERRWRRRWLLLGVVGLLALAVGDPGSVVREAARPGAAPPPGASEAGSTVRLTLELGASDPPERVEVTVYAEGEEAPCATHAGALPAVLAVPRGRALRVVAEAQGRARHVAELTLEGDRAVRIPLPPGERLTGRLVDDTGAAVEGGQVTLVRADGPALPWAARTDREGRFVVATLLPGRYEVRATAAGHAARSQADVEPGADLRLVLERVGLVAGRVVGPDGGPVPEATVVIAGSGIWPARHVAADEDGRFRIADVPPGVYEVRAHHGSLVAEPRRGLSVEASSPVHLTFALAEGAILRGIVRDSSTGRPVAGAEVTASAEALDVAPAAATTDEGGRFTIRGLASGAVLRVSVFAEGYVPAPPSSTRTPARRSSSSSSPGAPSPAWCSTSTSSPSPAPASRCSARATTASRWTSARAPASARPCSPPSSSPRPSRAPRARSRSSPGRSRRSRSRRSGSASCPSPRSPSSASEVRLGGAFATDRHGQFRVTGIPPGHVQVVARHAGRASASTARLYVASGAVRDDIELVLVPAGSLQVVVRDARGTGVEAVLVEARADGEPFPRVALTDDRGELDLDGLAGEVTVTATPRGRPAVRAAVTVSPGQRTEIALELEGELHTLSGRVVDEDGYPVAAAQLGGGLAPRGRPASPHLLRRRRRHLLPLRAARAAVARRGQRSRLRARRRGRALERRRGPRGARARRARLRRDPRRRARRAARRARRARARGAAPERLETRAGEDGSFAIARVRAGRWRLTIEADDHLPVEREVEIVDRGRGPDDVALDPIRLAPSGRLEGTVVDALGAPIARARVWVDEGPSTETDARGEFVLRGLEAGTMIARASHPAAGEGESGTVRVLAGRETPGLVLRLSERFDPERAASLPGRRRGVALTVTAARGAVRVQHVVPESRAAAAGLREGDVLETIDDVAPESAAHAARLLRGAPSVPAILGVRRGEERGVLVVERESWLPPEL
ncbi:MAG: carboxypeptidase regulatory-like domain-containing protein [Sandaracinaceae bacterium]|nr:carboxypeptidase regulatory-like domain-containing protein [Sandaracinaceae bacterium]